MPNLHLKKRLLLGVALGASVSAIAVPVVRTAYLSLGSPTKRADLSSYLNYEDETSNVEMPYRLTAGAMELGEGSNEEIGEAWDEALRRAMANRNYYGPGHEKIAADLVTAAQAEATKYPGLMPRSALTRSGPSAMAAGADSVLLTEGPGKAWVNLGPTDATYEFNGSEYLQVDSGRTTGVEVNPNNPNIVYTSTSGGGIWKTFNFSEKTPTWYPVTETIGQLAIGAMKMDPVNPDVLYAGLGDAFDTASGQMIKTLDGGITWSSAVQLSGEYPAGSGGRKVTAGSIRAIEVDPNNTNNVWVGTDVGLFRSTDAGATYALVDLVNAELTGNPGQRPEAIWSIVYTGKSAAGASNWLVSGHTASPASAAPPNSRTRSTVGDIWATTDGGQTWVSRLAENKLPVTATTLASRIDLGAGTPGADPTKTVIFAQAGLSQSTTIINAQGVWRSLNGGASFEQIPMDATALRNPTKGTNCVNPNVAAGQTFYNQVVAVDPKDNRRVFMGGTLCAVRTGNALDAKPLWDNVSHWLPSGGGGDTATTRLPYVHADHHVLKITYLPDGTANGQPIVILGTDGGLFTSLNALPRLGATMGAVTNTNPKWEFPNRGIVSHLFYNVTSGDVASGSQGIVFGGLQDNGTRMRDGAGKTTSFSQVIGGDGFGAAVAEVPGNRVLWGSVYYTDLRFCDPDMRDCSKGENWSYRSTPWTEYPNLICPGDNTNGHFYTRIQPIRTATAATGPAILTLTDLGAWRFRGDPFSAPGAGGWELLGNPSVTDGTGACLPPPTTVAIYTRNLGVSAVHDGLIGVALPSGQFKVTSNCQTDKPGSQCTWTLSKTTGVDLDGSGTITDDEKVSSTSSIDFPPGAPAAGKQLGDVYATASVAAVTLAGTPIPSTLGHVFITEDRGQTWRSLAGTGLPNVPAEVLRYDPTDLTSNTIYVGTSIGVYRTTDGGQTWSRFGAGMPMVPVKDLFVSKSGAFVRAATFGRGLWEIYPSATAEKGVNGNGDVDRNLQIDFQDVLATANRMGTSPATTVAPYYDWNQDLTGSVNGIDDADLSSVLVRFGDRP